MDLEQKAAQEAPDNTSDDSAIQKADVLEIPTFVCCSKIVDEVEDQKITKFKRERITFNNQQLEILEEIFKKCAYPDVLEVEDMKERLKLSETKLVVWFKNRRAKARRQDRDLDIKETPIKDDEKFGMPVKRKVKKSSIRPKRQAFSEHLHHFVPGSLPSDQKHLSTSQPIQFTYKALPTNQDIREAAGTVSAEFKPILLKILMQAPE